MGIAAEACELTEWKTWEYLDTLAAAHAEKGDFAQAIKWQEQAIKQLPLISIFSRPKLRARLDLYKQEVPFRDKELSPN